MGTIYCLTSPSGKKYIGQTTRSVDQRMKEHIKGTDCMCISAAIKKYGFEQMKLEILMECSNVHELDEWEQHYIKTLDSMCPNENLPLYLTKVPARPLHYCAGGYAVTNHPLLKNKYFTSKNMPDEEKFKHAYEYLLTCPVHRLNVDGSDESQA